jgi:hypothetical protein
MRKICPPELDAARVVHPVAGESPAGEMYGFFVFDAKDAIAVMSSGEADNDPTVYASDWEHISVARANRIPSWDDMKRMKELFWDDDECVVQFHPPKADYVNIQPYVLHIWKPPYALELPPMATL